MRNIYENTAFLDKRANDNFFIESQLLMENAGSGLASFIRTKSTKQTKVLFLCGMGDNGADGLCAARMLDKDADVSIYLTHKQKSPLAKKQLKIVKALGVNIVKTFQDADIYVDCIFGSGQKGVLDEATLKLLGKISKTKSIKIACDLPVKLSQNEFFKVDFTLCMGALKSVLFEDFAKDSVGEILQINLGISKENFETQSDIFLLEHEDMKLPIRDNKNTNKGDFGHLCVVCGEQAGAAILSALAGLNFGSGLVSLMSKTDIINKPAQLMQIDLLPKNATAIVVGMGLGDVKIDKNWFKTLPNVIDADLLHEESLKDLVSEKTVLTPHPKEFVSLLKIFTNQDISVDGIQQNRFKFAKEFSLNCKATLILKGANTLIAKDGKVFVCNIGNNSLAKAGSGDVLSGLIGALLAQGYNPLEASLSGVLAHAIASKNFSGNNYSLTPEDLIEGVKWL